MVVPFYTPTSTIWGFQFFRIFTNIWCCLFLALLVEVKWHLLMVLICIFLMITDVEHCHRLNSLGSRLTGRLVGRRFFRECTWAQHLWKRRDRAWLSKGRSWAIIQCSVRGLSWPYGKRWNWDEPSKMFWVWTSGWAFVPPCWLVTGCRPLREEALVY